MRETDQQLTSDWPAMAFDAAARVRSRYEIWLQSNYWQTTIVALTANSLCSALAIRAEQMQQHAARQVGVYIDEQTDRQTGGWQAANWGR